MCVQFGLADVIALFVTPAPRGASNLPERLLCTMVGSLGAVGSVLLLCVGLF